MDRLVAAQHAALFQHQANEGLRHASGAPDDQARPLQLLARGLAFTDPVTGQARSFESALRLTAIDGQWPHCAA